VRLRVCVQLRCLWLTHNNSNGAKDYSRQDLDTPAYMSSTVDRGMCVRSVFCVRSRGRHDLRLASPVPVMRMAATMTTQSLSCDK
jgi:hypothetical protein